MGDPYSQRVAGDRGETVRQNVDSGLGVSTGSQVKEITNFEFGSVGSNTAETITLTPPANHVWFGLNCLFSVVADPDATSGNHQLDIRAEGATSFYTSGQSDFLDDLVMEASEWVTASNFQKPSSPVAQVTAIQGVVASPNVGVQFKYSNNMDVAMENSRFISLTVREVAV